MLNISGSGKAGGWVKCSGAEALVGSFLRDFAVLPLLSKDHQDCSLQVSFFFAFRWPIQRKPRAPGFLRFRPVSDSFQSHHRPLHRLSELIAPLRPHHIGQFLFQKLLHHHPRALFGPAKVLLERLDHWSQSIAPISLATSSLSRPHRGLASSRRGRSLYTYCYLLL